MGALDHAVRSGKALYAGISNYNAEQTAAAAAILRRMGTPCLIHQFKYSMFQRTPEKALLDVLAREGIGGIVFSPAGAGTADGPVPGRHSRRFARRQAASATCSASNWKSAACGRRANCSTWRGSAARAWRRWLWHGRCVTMP